MSRGRKKLEGGRGRREAMLGRLVFQDPLGLASSTGPPARRGAGWAGGLGAQSWKFWGWSCL